MGGAWRPSTSGTRLCKLVALFTIPALVHSAIIQRVTGANQSEVSHASCGGGTHVYIAGTDIGSAFAPPVVFVGVNADAQCVVQPFTSNRNRLHCIVSAALLPAPDPLYSTTPRFVKEPLRVLKNGRLAQCWHVGGENHGCFLTFDTAGTPRVNRVLTPVVESGGMLRVRGHGINGGLQGDPKIISTMYRGSSLAVGACGQKDCQASNMGSETVGCLSRLGGEEGDSVSGQNNAVALAYSDDNSYGCQLDDLAGGLSGGYFNVSVYLNDQLRRGDAYFGFASSGGIDYATGDRFQAELLPRIKDISPRSGSTAGGADVTISGTGFGSMSSVLDIVVGGAACVVKSITEAAVICRVVSLSAPPIAPRSTLGSDGLVSYAGERGARWQWSASGQKLLAAFATPKGWNEVATPGETSHVEAWFEPPTDCDVTFLLRLDGVSKLYWSGNETASASEELASVSSTQKKPVLVELWANPSWNPHLAIPFANMDSFGSPALLFCLVPRLLPPTLLLKVKWALL